MQNNLICVRTCNGIFYYTPDEIIRCEASSNYTKLYFNNHKTLLVAKTLGQYETLLNAYNFIRIHQSSLINKTYIEKVQRNGTVILKDGSVLITSKRRKSFIKQQLHFLMPSVKTNRCVA